MLTLVLVGCVATTNAADYDCFGDETNPGFCAGTPYRDDCSSTSSDLQSNTPDECWTKCSTRVGAALVAIDFQKGGMPGYPGDTQCCCQDACPSCVPFTVTFTADSETKTLLVKKGFGDLPADCLGSSSVTTTCPIEDDPCLPSTAIVTLADGSTTTTVDALKEGDAIMAATADGQVMTDTVTLFSIAKPEVQATFINITTTGNVSLLLTAEHHLPVGAMCCSILQKAKDVGVGDMVWSMQAHTIVAQKVVEISKSVEQGLHSPVLTNGGFPVVNGLITSFDAIEKVTLAKYGLAPLLKACKATGTCESVRDLFLGDDRKYMA